MKSGVLLSSIFSIWIIAAIVAVYTLMPDISASIETITSLEQNSSITIDPTIEATEEQPSLTSYTPLGVFELLGL